MLQHISICWKLALGLYPYFTVLLVGFLLLRSSSLAEVSSQYLLICAPSFPVLFPSDMKSLIRQLVLTTHSHRLAAYKLFSHFVSSCTV